MNPIVVFFFSLTDMTSVEEPNQADSFKRRKRKRGRPSKVSDKERDWTDEEVFALINLWSRHECLYNLKSPDFLKKGKRSIAIGKLVHEFQDTENPPTPTQVQQKLTRLRCYYTAENSKIERSKTSCGGDAESLYTPSWKFFNSLHFLRNDLFVLSAKNSTEDSTGSSAYKMVNRHSSPISQRAIAKKERTNAKNVTATARQSLDMIETRHKEGNNVNQTQDCEDKKLSDMIFTMLQTIPEGAPKAMLRLELQQKIIQVKFGVQDTANDSQNRLEPFLNQTPQVPTKRNFTSPHLLPVMDSTSPPTMARNSNESL